MFDRDLGQKQAAAALPADEEAVTAHFDFFGQNRLRGREDAQLNCKMRSFFPSNRRKAVVVESRGTRGFRHGSIDRAGAHIADAATQFFSALASSKRIVCRTIVSRQIVAQVERSEYSAGLGKVRGRGLEGNLPMIEGGRDGIMRQTKQLDALFLGEFLDGNHRRRRIMLWERHRHLPVGAPVAACGDGSE